jgi:hypothetical protein
MNYYYDGQVREDKMSEIYSMHGRYDNCIQYSVKQPQGKRPLERSKHIQIDVKK